MSTFDPFGYDQNFNQVLTAIAAVQKTVNTISQNQASSLAALSIEIASVATAQSAQGVTLQTLLTNMEKIMATLDDLVADVAAETTTIASLSTFIQGLQAQIGSAGLSAADQAKVDAIFANLQSNDAALAAAMTANVPPTPAQAATVPPTVSKTI